DPFGRSRDDLEPPRKAHIAEARPHRLVGYEERRLGRFEHGESDCRIAKLARTGERRQWQLAASRPEPDVVPAIDALHVVEVRAEPAEPCADLGRVCDEAARRLPSTEHGRPAATEDSRLFCPDRLGRVAEPLAMVEPDRYDGRDVSIQDVDGVQ